MEQYTWLEFCVKPSLIKEYMKAQDLPNQRALFQIYLDHLQSVCYEDSKFQGKKFKRLLQVIYQINDTYTPILSDFSKKNLQFELVQHYFKEAQQTEYYKLLFSAYTLEYLTEYILHKEITPERLNSMINLKELETFLTISTEPIAILNVQRLIEFYMLQEEHNIEHLFSIHDKLHKTLAEFPVAYSTQKIEDYRYIILQSKDELSPVTDSDESQDQQTVSRQNKPANRSFIEKEILDGPSSTRIIVIYLQNGISTNNRELLLQLQRIVNGADPLVDKLITIFLKNCSIPDIDQIIRQLDIAAISEINIISIVAQLICKFANGNKDVTKVLINLINKFYKTLQDQTRTLQDQVKSISEFVDIIQKLPISMPCKIDQYNQNVQLALSLILSHSDIKLLLEPIQELFTNCLDNLTFFIENCLSKFILEQIQALILKSITEYNPLDFNNYYSLMPILNQDYPSFEIKLPHDVKVKLLIKSFKREKIVTIQQFDQSQLEDKLQFKYSKLYKKQSLFHYKNQQYNKSIRQIVKYFEAYLYSPQFEVRQYIAEIRVLECLFQNFKSIGASTHSLIASQFICYTLENAIFENLDISEELAQFFFDGRMIEKICAANRHNQPLLKLMVERLQDPDCYVFKTNNLLLQTQEKYLSLFINYLSEKMVI
ncbi:unnamed protein product [Paramecium sonneborni]|uniref:Uncharacterized protein n=1 Tax=Paramecium sonneborni TaxID=65129 RepID=A0A8S1RGC4_9CILI|nr:unnamed protein product [Paramecium sonneborni]